MLHGVLFDAFRPVVVPWALETMNKKKKRRRRRRRRRKWNPSKSCHMMLKAMRMNNVTMMRVGRKETAGCAC